MASKSRLLILVALLLIPSALFLWFNADVPKFCDLHDDCIYFVSAKSLADGGGYRITSLPGEPAQTKYPPLYPLLLSVAWQLVPEFPANLMPAVWLSYLCLPVMLYFLGRLYPKLGFEGWRGVALLALVAVNPYTISFSSSLLSELMFVALLAASLLLAERSLESGWKWAAASGVVMGLAYLSRSAGIVAVVSMPLYFLLRRRRELAGWFGAAMLPFVTGWMVWARMHQAPAIDPDFMYYVDYTGYQLYNVAFSDVHLLLWKNIDGIVYAFGSLLLPRISDSIFLKVLSEVLGVAAICGVVRMVRRGQAVAYALFALGSSALLAIWHFPPTERFVYPMFPLALAGFWTEMEHLAGMLRAGLAHVDREQRIAARTLLTAVAAMVVACVGVQIFTGAVLLPVDAQGNRDKREAQAASLAWVRRNTPESAAFLATRDPMFYLSTGRHAISRRVAPKYWYRDDREAIVDYFRTVVPYAQQHELAFVYYGGADFGWAIDGELRGEIDAVMQHNPQLRETFHDASATLYSTPTALTAATH